MIHNVGGCLLDGNKDKVSFYSVLKMGRLSANSYYTVVSFKYLIILGFSTALLIYTSVE